ncbi:MAG: s-methyl-5-thioribose-1-phosphate isomerase [Bacillota bacterium]|nr:s-methyl-5-thioribose-1-phosphate isomerase [Bacillota bacterium]
MIRYDKNMPFLLKYENVAWYENGKVTILDRRIYPKEVKFVICKSYTDVIDAIKNMVTQSAGPYTAVGMAMALAAYESRNMANEKRIRFLEDAEYALSHARPTTAFRYGKITSRALKIAKDAIKHDLDPVPLIVEDTIASLNRRYKTMQMVGDNLIKLIPENGTILTQCYGETIVGALIVAAKREKKKFKVLCAETRPFLQGARLTASCFAESGFDTTVITDNMAADVMSKGMVDLFTSAADTITEDGSVVNKVGTYQLALLSKFFKIPYFVTGIPDKGVKNLDQVPIEMRDPEEVLKIQGEKHSQLGVKGYYPAFDKTPADLVRAIVTDKDIYKPEMLKTYFDQTEKDFY